MNTPCRSGVILYDGLPIGSGGGHGLGRLTPTRAYSAAEGFFESLTTTPKPSSIEVGVHFGPSVEPSKSYELEKSLTAVFSLSGQPFQRRSHGPNETAHSWSIAPGRAAEVAEWIESANLDSSHWLGGAAYASLTYAFALRAGPRGEVLEFQDRRFYGEQELGYGIFLGESRAHVRFTSKCSFSVQLFFPFEEPSPDFWSYVATVERALPFKFSAKHWSHWRLNKQGLAYYSRRLPFERVRPVV